MGDAALTEFFDRPCDVVIVVVVVVCCCCCCLLLLLLLFLSLPSSLLGRFKRDASRLTPPPSPPVFLFKYSFEDFTEFRRC